MPVTGGRQPRFASCRRQRLYVRFALPEGKPQNTDNRFDPVKYNDKIRLTENGKSFFMPVTGVDSLASRAVAGNDYMSVLLCLKANRKTRTIGSTP